MDNIKPNNGMASILVSSLVAIIMLGSVTSFQYFTSVKNREMLNNLAKGYAFYGGEIAAINSYIANHDASGSSGGKKVMTINDDIKALLTGGGKGPHMTGGGKGPGGPKGRDLASGLSETIEFDSGTTLIGGYRGDNLSYSFDTTLTPKTFCGYMKAPGMSVDTELCLADSSSSPPTCSGTYTRPTEEECQGCGSYGDPFIIRQAMNDKLGYDLVPTDPPGAFYFDLPTAEKICEVLTDGQYTYVENVDCKYSDSSLDPPWRCGHNESKENIKTLTRWDSKASSWVTFRAKTPPTGYTPEGYNNWWISKLTCGCPRDEDTTCPPKIGWTMNFTAITDILLEKAWEYRLTDDYWKQFNGTGAIKMTEESADKICEYAQYKNIAKLPPPNDDKLDMDCFSYGYLVDLTYYLTRSLYRGYRRCNDLGFCWDYWPEGSRCNFHSTGDSPLYYFVPTDDTPGDDITDGYWVVDNRNNHTKKFLSSLICSDPFESCSNPPLYSLKVNGVEVDTSDAELDNSDAEIGDVKRIKEIELSNYPTLDISYNAYPNLVDSCRIIFDESCQYNFLVPCGKGRYIVPPFRTSGWHSIRLTVHPRSDFRGGYYSLAIIGNLGGTSNINWGESYRYKCGR